MAKKKIATSTHLPKTVIPWIALVQLVIFTTLLLCLPVQNSYLIRANSETFTQKTHVPAPTPAAYPTKISSVDPPPLTAEGIMITDIASGVTLFEKNPDLQLLPASTTKIMTALVVLEDYKLDEVVEVGTIHTENNVMGLQTGEKITVENLLYGLLVYSANDAALALAQHHQGSVAGFVNRMNEKKDSLHLQNTHFTNPVGFDDHDQYTTVHDLTRLSLVALKNKTLAKIVGIPQITVSDITFTYFHQLKNVNALLGKIPGVSGIKTGFTQEAGECLVTTAQKDNQRVLLVLLRSKDRFGETEQLINWVFANTHWVTLTPP